MANDKLYGGVNWQGQTPVSYGLREDKSLDIEKTPDSGIREIMVSSEEKREAVANRTSEATSTQVRESDNRSLGSKYFVR